MSDAQHTALFTAVYGEHHTWLQRWLYRRLGCPEVAADLAQDTFVRVLHKRALSEVEQPRAYLATIAHSLFVNLLRRRQLEQSYLEALAQLPEALMPSPEERLQLLQTLDALDIMLNGRLEGDSATLIANGVLLGDARRHVDTRLGIEHIARDTACGLTWRGIADGRSRVVFHGGIDIRPGADGTDAALSNKNLLLSADAEIDTQPVLVIDADEVKAAHGATVGQLDANALFYLRSRGVPEARARRLLTVAFCREPLLALEDDGLRALLLARLDAALASGSLGGDDA